MTWLLFYSSFKQLINELHTCDMTPPCPIIFGIYFMVQSSAALWIILDCKLALEAVVLITKAMQEQ